MDYAAYVTIMSQLLTVPVNDPTFVSVLPRIIDYAEQRSYREGDFLTTVTRDSSVACTANLRTLPLPTDIHFVTVQQVNIITPAGTTNPDLGTRNPLSLATKEFLDNVYGSATGATVPSYVSTLSDQTFLLGPWPDQAYTVEFIGTIRPAPLSPTNQTTFLTLYLPDMFVAASMVFGAGYQRDFGAQTSDPQLGMSWEQTYTKLFSSSNFEELRKKWAGGAWSPMGQAQTATQARGANAA